MRAHRKSVFRSALVAAVVLLGASPAISQTKPVVAVFELKNRHVSLSDAVLSSLREHLATRLVAAGTFNVLPSDSLQKALLAKKKESYEQRFDMGTQVELGRELAAQLTLATQIMKVGEKCMVSSTLYDLKKSTAQKAALAEGACNQEGLTRSIDELVAKLASTDLYGNKVHGADGRQIDTASDGELTVRLWTDRGSGDNGGTYTKGELMYVFVQPSKDCYLQLFYQQADGTSVQIFPNAQAVGDKKLLAGNTYMIPGPNDAFEFEVSPPFGQETLRALASTQPLASQKGEVTDTGLTVLNQSVNDTVVRTRGIAVKGKKAKLSEATLRLTTRSTP